MTPESSADHSGVFSPIPLESRAGRLRSRPSLTPESSAHHSGVVRVPDRLQRTAVWLWKLFHGQSRRSRPR